MEGLFSLPFLTQHGTNPAQGNLPDIPSLGNNRQTITRLLTQTTTLSWFILGKPIPGFINQQTFTRSHFASYLTMRGKGQRAVQELLGHKTPAMTARYSHLSKQYLREAVESLDELHEEAANG